MNAEKKKKIILGVTGGIAAYKSAELCSLLCKASYDVHVIMTANAQKLMTERCFLTLSRNPVICNLWDVPEWRPEHIELSESADLLVVAPCTANFIGKYTHGIADDALTTFAATFGGPVVIAPAMNPKMWHHPACRANAETLRSRGVRFVGPESGRVACGADGEGRLAGIENILTAVREILG